jgi:hypothetical protein
MTVLACIPIYFNYSILECDITWFGKQAHFLDELNASIFSPIKEAAAFKHRYSLP